MTNNTPIPRAELEAVIAELDWRRQSAEKSHTIAHQQGQIIEEQSDFATMAAYLHAVKLLRALLDKETSS